MDDGKYYSNKMMMRDGNVMLYQLKRTAKPVWQARIKKPGTYATAKDRYVDKSMRTTDLAEATVKATTIYDDLRYRANNDLPIDILTVAQVYARYMATEGRGGSVYLNS